MSKKKCKNQNLVQVIFPANNSKPPQPHEIDVADILAHHYHTTVNFLAPIDDYKRKTPDIIMHGVEWEIKCPTGSSKFTIQRQFQRATKQAKNIIIDTRHSKLDYEYIEKAVHSEIKKRPHIKKIILIDKLKNVVAIKS